MGKTTPKNRALEILGTALLELQRITYAHRDKDAFELMLVISAICGAFNEGWLGELIEFIEAKVAEKHPELAKQIEVARQRKR